MITRQDKLDLGTITTRDESGKHFTELHSAEWLDAMEDAGFLEIVKPVHEATGIPYSQEEWSVKVADEVANWFDAYGSFTG